MLESDVERLHNKVVKRLKAIMVKEDIGIFLPIYERAVQNIRTGRLEVAMELLRLLDDMLSDNDVRRRTTVLRRFGFSTVFKTDE